jgi:hypothetical protein
VVEEPERQTKLCRTIWFGNGAAKSCPARVQYNRPGRACARLCEAAKRVSVELRRLNPEQHAKLSAWCDEEIDALKSKGASEADLQEPAFANLVFQRTFTSHFDEIRANPEFAEAIFLTFLGKASPEYLRKWAAEEREKGNLDMAYDIEVIADRSERTGVSPFPERLS